MPWRLGRLVRDHEPLAESARCVGSVASMADTLFPIAPLLAGSRTDTGIIATSGTSGSASWSISQRRSAPALIAITTSLTEKPKAFFTFLTLSSSTLRKATRRCGVIGLLNGVAGARPATLGSTPPSPRPSPSSPPTSGFSAGPTAGSTRISSLAIRTVCTGRQASREAASAVSLAQVGGWCGVNGADAGSSRPSGVRSSSSVSSSEPDTPSIAAWWIFV